MKKKNRQIDFSLSFLDIMACGLGAVIIIFVLLKDKSINKNNETEFEKLLKIIETKEFNKNNLELERNLINKKINDENRRISDLNLERKKIVDQITSINREIEENKDNVNELQQIIKKNPLKKKIDIVKNEKNYEANYIVGLNVRGKKIVILLDSSASMTDEKLIDIIKRKNSNNNEKLVGPKWKRANKIAKWIISRSPEQSSISLIKFNENAKYIHKKVFLKKNKKDVVSVINGIDKIVPTGSTNLYSALKLASNINPTNIYLITDGLPTKGDPSFVSFNPLSKCNSIIGKSKNISGECRKILFRKTINTINLNEAEVNIILLPLEGDPEASPEFWNWSSASSGMLISPARNWP